MSAPKKTTKNPSYHDVATKLRKAIKQAEALNKTLEEANELAKGLPIEKGKGLLNLITLTKQAAALAASIAKA